MLVVGCVMQYIMHCCYLRFGGFFNSISLGLPRLFRACVLASRCLGWNGIRCIDWLPTCIGLAKIGQRLQISTIVLLQHRELVHRGQVKIGGPEQAPGPHPFHTPVPYPCSIPPWRIRSIPLFHTSDPYVIIYIIIYNYYLYIYTYNYIYIDCVQSDFTFVRTYMSARTYMRAYMQEYVYYAQALWLCWQVCACSTYSCYLLCCVMVGMCLAAASWQSKNGLLVTLPPSQPVAGLCLHHLKLLQAVAQLWCLILEMRLAAASWQSKNCLLR